MLWIVWLALQATQVSAQDIAIRMNDVNRGKDVVGQMQMKIITPQGFEKDRQLTFSRLSIGTDDRLYFQFEQPADVKGTQFLLWSQSDSQNSVWLFLPALKKTRRLSGSSQYESFMGSDFLYEDLNRRSPSKDRFEGGNVEPCDKWKCYVIDAFPKDDLPYQKRRILVRTDNFLPVRVDFFSSNGDRVKTQENTDIRIHQNIWTVFSSVMSQTKSKAKTIIRFKDLEYDKGLQEKDFAVSRLR